MDIAAALPVKTPQRPDANRAPSGARDPYHDDFETELANETASPEQDGPAKSSAPQTKPERPDAPEAKPAEEIQSPDAALPTAQTAVMEPLNVATALAGQVVTTKADAIQTAAALAASTPIAQGAAQPQGVSAPTAPATNSAGTPQSANPAAPTPDGHEAVAQTTTAQAQMQAALAVAEAIAAPKPATSAHKKHPAAHADATAAAQTPSPTHAAAPQAQAATPPAAAHGQNGAGQDKRDQGQAQGAAVGATATAHAQTQSPQNPEFKLDASATASVMQPASPPAQNAAPVAPALIAQNAPVFIPPEALGVAIARKALEGVNKFELRLDPPEMGRLDVSLEVDDAGNVRAHIRAERPEALELLQREAKGMEQALRQAGLSLDQSSLSFSLSGREGREAQDQSQHGRRAKFQAVLPEDEIHNAIIRGASASAAGVDLRV